MDQPGNLSEAEWNCLESIANSENVSRLDSAITEDGNEPCSRETIEQLRLAGLVEIVAVLWLPLEMKRSVVRLTAEGKRVLARRSKQ